MGRDLHQLRSALGRGFDEPPDWANLCPPYEESSTADISLLLTLSLSLEDTTEDAISRHLLASGSRRPRHCVMLIRDGSGVRILLSDEHPKSILDDSAAAGRQATLHFVNDVRKLSVVGISRQSETALSSSENSHVQYNLTATSDLNVESYSMSYNRTYDAKGRPKTAAGQISRQKYEERLVQAQNSVLTTGARCLGRAGDEDAVAAQQVPDLSDDVRSEYA